MFLINLEVIGCWNDVLNSTVFTYLKLKEEIGILVSFDTLMKEESIIALELGFLASNIRRKKLWCLIYFIFNLKKEGS